MKILSIETSCDETSVAVVDSGRDNICILSNVVDSQIKIHQNYGGVVPELAARKHAETITLVAAKALEYAEADKEDIDAIAVTTKPGLVIALFVGVDAAKALSLAWDKPIIGVNHLEGHIYSALGVNTPFLSLIVSGGHTQLVLVKEYGDYTLIGKTLDDAAGEAFDKVAKTLSLPYPGGPAISKVAEKGLANRYEMPLSMINSGDYNFSFSGIKTHVAHLVVNLEKDNKDIKKETPDIAASFQEAVCEILVAKTMAAALYHNLKTITVTGGVSANKCLQEKFKAAVEIESMNLIFPDPTLTGDNAAMIGIAGYLKSQKYGFDDLSDLKVAPKATW